MDKQSWYEFIESQNDDRSNKGFDYEGKIFEKSIERVVYQLFESTKYIKNYINYTVPKNNKYVR